MLNTLRQWRRTIVLPRGLVTVETTFDEGVDLLRRRSAASAAIRDVRGVDGGNARMITCDSLVYQPFQPDRRRARLRRRQRPIDRRTRGHADLHLQRARDPRVLSRDRRRVRVVSARHPLRAQGEFDAGDRPPAALARQPRRCQLRRRDRGRASARVSRRRTSSSPASARRATSSSTRWPRASAPSTPNRQASSIASPRSRARRAASRASRCASIPTSTRGAIRTSRPA